jgi:hypothetical protein
MRGDRISYGTPKQKESHANKKSPKQTKKPLTLKFKVRGFYFSKTTQLRALGYFKNNIKLAQSLSLHKVVKTSFSKTEPRSHIVTGLHVIVMYFLEVRVFS